MGFLTDRKNIQFRVHWMPGEQNEAPTRPINGQAEGSWNNWVNALMNTQPQKSLSGFTLLQIGFTRLRLIAPNWRGPYTTHGCRADLTCRPGDRPATGLSANDDDRVTEHISSALQLSEASARDTRTGHLLFQKILHHFGFSRARWRQFNAKRFCATSHRLSVTVCETKCSSSCHMWWPYYLNLYRTFIMIALLGILKHTPICIRIYRSSKLRYLNSTF